MVSLLRAKVLVLASISLLSTFTHAMDVAVITRPQTDTDRRLDYSYDMLEAALKITEEEYGPYQVKLADIPMVRDRQFAELLRGDKLNVTISPPKPGWEQATRIPYPLQRGIASYRLLLVNKKDQNMFANVSSVNEIKSYRYGADTHWSTTLILKHHGFNVVIGPNYNTLFKMLSLGRFDVFPRGANEIFDEMEFNSPIYPNLTIEPNIALFMYLPTYFYVSPQHPRLAERIHKGIFLAHESGALDVVYNRHFANNLRLAQLHKRKIFIVENNNLLDGMYEHDKPYLLRLEELSSTPIAEQ